MIGSVDVEKNHTRLMVVKCTHNYRATILKLLGVSIQ